MVTCPDCATQYDQSAASCPNCGRPNPLRQPGGSSEAPRDTPPGATGGAYAGGASSGGASPGGASPGGAAGGTGGAYGGAAGQGGGYAGGAPGAGGPYAGAPAGGAQYGGARPEIPNYLVFSIFVTLCCCVPLGIPALISAARVDARRDLGDYDGAWAASREAKKWAIIALGVGLAIYAIYMLMQGAIMAMMAGIAESQGAGLEGM